MVNKNYHWHTPLAKILREENDKQLIYLHQYAPTVPCNASTWAMLSLLELGLLLVSLETSGANTKPQLMVDSISRLQYQLLAICITRQT